MPTDEMIAELSAAPDFLPSAFWTDLANRNDAMLGAEGLRSFKRTVSNNYFNWPVTVPYHPYFVRAFLSWLTHPTTAVLGATIEDRVRLHVSYRDQPIDLSAFQKQIYKFFVCFTWETMRRFDTLRLSDRVQEPRIGNPIEVTLGGRLISQDVANSVIEANLLLPLVSGIAKPRFAEIGAGYGRLAHVVSNTTPSLYCIFDIPPALDVAQWYLRQILPEKRVFAFRRFKAFAEIEDELSQCDLAFFTSNQLASFPDSWFDVASTISTLPEMTARQVDLFLGLMRSKTRHAIFLKQWKSWRNAKDGIHMRRDDYVMPPPWRQTVDRTDPLIPTFFNTIWERKGAPQLSPGKQD